MPNCRLLVATLLALGLAAPSAQAASDAKFPDGFLWGAATAAHQVEGGLTNDWVEWEKGKGHVANGDLSAVGIDEYHRYDADFALAQGMGMNVHRLSVEWARIEPKEGQIDWKAVDHYHAVFASLKQHHLRPMVTLFHFTNPTWVAAQHGWLNPKTEADFARFAGFMGHEFGKEVDLWCTLNEPNVYAFNAYDAGNWPPMHKDRSEALTVMAALLRAHAQAYRALHTADHALAAPGLAWSGGGAHPCLVGVANHIAPFDPLRWWHPVDRALAYFNNDVFNEAPLRAASLGVRRFQIPGATGVNETRAADASCVDFVGVNYYTRWVCVSGGASAGGSTKERIPMPGRPVTAMGWEDYPEGFYRALKLGDHYAHLPDGRHVPVIVTENGVDDPHDTARSSYLVRHLAEVARAIHDGVDVRGYIHWTLADNFEWADGFRPKFGLFKVDRTPKGNLARTPSAAVPVFTQIIRDNGLAATQLESYGAAPRR